jgi:NADPH-dependent 2,4-dienoyl-CoA reductase/sulfur reductase-like enzyme
MGIGGAQALLKGGAEMRGTRVVLAGSGPLILPVAAALARAGARLAIVAEQAPMSRVARFGAGLWAHPGKLAQAAVYRAAFRAVPYRMGTWVESAEGDGRVQRVTLTNGRRRWSEPCDLLCCSHGLVPNTALARVIGCATYGGRVVVDTLQRTTVPGVYCAGEPTGIAGELAALVQGEIAGLAAAGRDAEANAPRLQRARESWRTFASALATTFALRDHVRALPQRDTIICRCEDVPLHRIDPMWSARQAKLYTRLGMGPCQGNICGAACSVMFGWEPDTVRPPVGGAEVATLVGSRNQEG